MGTLYMSLFRGDNWYWIVGGDTTRVFSSAAAAYVPVNDATYAAWLKDTDHLPTAIASEAELWDVLARSYPAGIPAGNSAAQDQYKALLVNRLDQVAMRIAFNHENRIRALEGKQAVTAAQFIAAIKALL